MRIIARATARGGWGGSWNCSELPPSIASCRSMRVSVADGSTEPAMIPFWRRSSPIESIAPRSPNFDAV